MQFSVVAWLIIFWTFLYMKRTIKIPIAANCCSLHPWKVTLNAYAVFLYSLWPRPLIYNIVNLRSYFCFRNTKLLIYTWYKFLLWQKPSYIIIVVSSFDTSSLVYLRRAAATLVRAILILIYITIILRHFFQLLKKNHR